MVTTIGHWLMLVIIIAIPFIILYFYILWYCLKSAVKHGVEEALREVLHPDALTNIDIKKQKQEEDFQKEYNAW